jgi:hypothetical protein
MMRVIRKIGFFSLLVVATLFIQNASAALTYLPNSSYAVDTWEGFRYYNEDLGGGNYLRGRIDFTVYDTDNLLWAGEMDLAEELDLSGRYIYAYQILNNLYASDEAVEYFAVFSDSGNPMDVFEDSIGSYEDPGSGLEPADAHFTSSNLEGVWEFKDQGDFSCIYKGDHSWFLVFSSDYAPVVGDYEIRGIQEEGDIPTPEIAEPGTLTLLGLSSAAMLIKRRKSARQRKVSLHK